MAAKSYTDLANGAEYLRRFPEGEQVPTVLTRLNTLADNLHAEIVLYQGMGDTVKAMERMRELTQQSTSSSTELAASAEQMSKMARSLLEAMDRFVVDASANGNARHGSARRHEGEHVPAAKYAALARS